MTTTITVELLAGFLAASLSLWFVFQRFTSLQPLLARGSQLLRPRLTAYVLTPGRMASLGLLLLRLSFGVMMIHHGQEKLADPQNFAHTYVASLHLPFPLFFAYLAGFSELMGSWLVILGLLTPLGALAIAGTMSVAAYQHILTGGFNIYVLELVVLYLGSSLALLLVGPGRYSFDAGMVSALLSTRMTEAPSDTQFPGASANGFEPAYIRAESDQLSHS
jgi:putative oxidoreductase